jgi:hypothetical protein
VDVVYPLRGSDEQALSEKARNIKAALWFRRVMDEEHHREFLAHLTYSGQLRRDCV